MHTVIVEKKPTHGNRRFDHLPHKWINTVGITVFQTQVVLFPDAVKKSCVIDKIDKGGVADTVPIVIKKLVAVVITVLFQTPFLSLQS